MPVVSVVIGEGGSGGAIALAAADRVLMLEHAIYSVISPEGCASILWRTNEAAQQAAEALRLTAEDLKKLGVIDAVIEEPVGGAHRNRADAIRRTGDALAAQLGELAGVEGRRSARTPAREVPRHGQGRPRLEPRPVIPGFI